MGGLTSGLEPGLRFCLLFLFCLLLSCWRYFISFSFSGTLGFKLKNIVSDVRLTQIFRPMAASNPWDIVMNLGEKPVDKNSFVNLIEIDNPPISFSLFGWETHLLDAVFIVLFLLNGFAFKGFFGVEL